MNKKGFNALVVLVILFVGWVIFAGNRLPAELRKQIQSEQKNLEAAKQKLADQRRTVTQQASAEPVLFQVRGFDHESLARLNEAGAALSEADRLAAQLAILNQRNRKSTTAEVEDLIRRERERRAAALNEADQVAREADMRMSLKRNFPETLQKIQTSAVALQSADYSPVIAKVEKSEADWPSKRDDLQAKLNALIAPKKEAPQWVEAAKELAAKPKDQLNTADYTRALEIDESVSHAPGPAQAVALSELSHQLYTSWDNVLEDLDKEHGVYREKIKHVVTTVPAPGSNGSTTSDNLWKDVSPDQWHVLEKDVGMSVAHKPLGKYDSEADLTPEPPGFAYMASPSEGRNQYGYWDHREGGSVWTWLPEYLILRDLLSNRSYQPVPSWDWDRYRQSQRYGKTYYGYDTSGAPRYGSHGTFTLQRYANSRYVQSGGFSGSKYGSSGGFSGSKYGNGSTPSMGSSSTSGNRFGSSSSSSGPKKFGSSSSGGMHFGSSSHSSSGRSFGGRRR